MNQFSFLSRPQNFAFKSCTGHYRLSPLELDMTFFTHDCHFFLKKLTQILTSITRLLRHSYILVASSVNRQVDGNLSWCDRAP